MSIAFVASRAIDLIGNHTEATTTLNRDPNYSPVELVNTISGGDTRAFFTRIAAPTGSEVWIHFRMTTSNQFVGSGSDGVFLRTWEEDGSIRQSGGIQVNNGNVLAEAIGNSTVVGVEFSMANNTNYTFDVRIADVSTNRVVDIYVDGSLVSTASASNTAAYPLPTFIEWVCQDVTNNNGDEDIQLSEIIITEDENTLGWRLAELSPNALGNYDQWTGGNTELSDGDKGTYAISDTANQRQSWTPSTYNGPASPTSIRGVVAKARASIGPSGPQNLAQFLRIASTDYDGTGTKHPTAGFQQYLEVWDNNPNTAVAWATADFATMEVGLKSEA